MELLTVFAQHQPLTPTNCWIRFRIAVNSSRGTATSAIWGLTCPKNSRISGENVLIFAGRRRPPKTLPHGLHFCTSANDESAFKIRAATVPKVTSLASLTAQDAHQSGTLALCAHGIIDTCTETPANVHGNQGNFISPIKSFSNRRMK